MHLRLKQKVSWKNILFHLKQQILQLCTPTESLYKELTEYQNPSTKELLTKLMKKYKIVISGPNTLSAYLQSLHMGFQSLKVQRASEIYNHLKTITIDLENILIILLRLKN